MRVLLTGASGFVGIRLAHRIDQQVGFNLICAVRREGSVPHGREVVIGEFDGDCDWSEAVLDRDVVVHAAARAHVMKDREEDPLTEYRKTNVQGTLNLGRQAAQAGVRRFVFVSSIKVNGEQTPIDQPFTAEDEPSPSDAYAISKFEAEQGLIDIGLRSGMEVVIIRPPLVYGPGVKGNFASMIRIVEKGLPLPLGAIHNKRSLVGVDNLVDLIVTAIGHPAAANQIFLAGDGEDLSTTELLNAIASAMGKPSRLIPFPEGLLMAAATMLGKKEQAQRLLGSLRVDIAKARVLLGWQPPFSVEESLGRCFLEMEDSV